jgi:sigma-B regulation protein RsbU (phosphoserine phosphatase)
MKPADIARHFAENRGELLASLERTLCPDGSSLQLLDPAGGTVWPEGPEESGASPGLAVSTGAPDAAGGCDLISETAIRRTHASRILLGPYGALQVTPPGGNDGIASILPGTHPGGVRLESAVGTLLTSNLEVEAELDQLVDDHISTTNQLLALYKIINGTLETWELPAKLEVILAEAARQTTAGQAALCLDDPRQPLSIWRGPTGPAQENALTLLDELRHDPRARIDPAGSFVAAPIIVRGQVAGSLLVTEPPTGGYKAKDLKLVRALSELAAGFVTTARLQDQVIANLRLEQEIEIATRIQTQLLPRELPACPGLSLAAACQPAFHVGGDFYTVVRQAGGDLVFALGDVAGKGVPAALLMAMTRTILMTLSRHRSEPMEILRGVNDVLYEDLEKVGKFVTLVVGRYRAQDARIDLANAGHSPVLLLADPHADPVLIPPQQPPLGVFPDVCGESARFSLSEGGMLAIMSDGLTEARNPSGEFFGTGRLQAMVREGAQVDPRTLGESILHQVEVFAAGAPRADDQTLLLLRRNPRL